jgi:hypothetical protein
MKKQIIAAAVAASVSAVALADISITGSTKVNYTYTDTDGNGGTKNSFKNETDLVITGKTGDTSVVMKLAMDEGQSTKNGVSVTSDTVLTTTTVKTGITTNATTTSTAADLTLGYSDGDQANLTDDGHAHTTTESRAVGNSLALEDVYLTTKIGDVSLKVGDWDNGDMPLRASSRGRNKVQASTSMGGLNLTWVSGAEQDDEISVGTSIGGLNVSYKKKTGAADYSVKGELAGFNFSHVALTSDTADMDRDVTEISTSAGGVGIKVGMANADKEATITGDSWFGDYEDNTGVYELGKGMDVAAVELSTSMDGNKVVFRHASIDKDTATADKDRSFNKIIVTRPLGNGTTFEMTYTDSEKDGTPADSNQSLDLELAVKF